MAHTSASAERAPTAGRSALRAITMATLPGLPQTDEPEPDALPVEPDDGMPQPSAPDEPKGRPGESPLP
jgi:hypothetical protein